ncbi:hypothetical protein D3C87_75800 [compost metagenome]
MEEQANKYAGIYSVYGLQQMIEEEETNINYKKKEREDVGKSWTPEMIECHRHAMNEEISMIEERLEVLKEALQIRQKQQEIEYNI